MASSRSQGGGEEIAVCRGSRPKVADRREEGGEHVLAASCRGRQHPVSGDRAAARHLPGTRQVCHRHRGRGSRHRDRGEPGQVHQLRRGTHADRDCRDQPRPRVLRAAPRRCGEGKLRSGLRHVRAGDLVRRGERDGAIPRWGSQRPPAPRQRGQLGTVGGLRRGRQGSRFGERAGRRGLCGSADLR